MMTYKLSEIAHSTKGKKPKTLSKEKTNGFAIPYVDIKAFEKGIIDNYTDGENCTFCTPDDVLIVWDGARCGFVGRGIEGAIGSTLAKISSEKYTNDFLFYFLQSKYKVLNSNPRGVGIPHIEPNLLWNFEIPDLDKSTQHQIVSRIESLFAELDKAEEHLRNAQQQLKTYKQAVLNHWLNNEDGKWETVNIQHFLDKSSKSMITGPFGSALKKSEHQCSGIPVLGIENIGEGSFKMPNKIFVTEEKAKELKGFMVLSEDIIISRSGTVGEICKVPTFMNGALLSTNLIRVRLSLDVISADYFVLLFQCSQIRQQVKNLCKGTTRAFLNQTILNQIEFPFPPLSDQQRIVQEIESRLSQAEAAEARIAESLQKTEALRQSILKKAFSGELV
jgi:type I restriction enzyme S subunit